MGDELTILCFRVALPLFVLAESIGDNELLELIGLAMSSYRCSALDNDNELSDRSLTADDDRLEFDAGFPLLT